MQGKCQWTKDGFGLGVDPDLPGYPRFTMSECNLAIYPVLPEDEGDYHCQVLAAPAASAIVSSLSTTRRRKENPKNLSSLNTREKSSLQYTKEMIQVYLMSSCWTKECTRNILR